ncbi:DUF4332 domain-containing protein [Draconibacterium mangrovi]|uniref:DUF4332 domain-containing protein n=1 Tax=Draconibacterium mangrovi TaxID=2697469 RepID=UPI0013D1BAD7|nr:DUF4332 domain-containing protein [Draconibacterium mangrovi]
MGYYIDLEKICLNKYKEMLRSVDLLPGRMIIKENLDLNFEVLKREGIKNVDEILKALKNKKSINDFALNSGLEEGYLTVLVREIKSYQPKPNKLKDFPGISENDLMKLEEIQIKNTVQLFDRATTKHKRNDLCQQTGIDKNDLLKITKLTDLARIRWVNHTFAFVLFEAGYDTVEKVANGDSEKLYQDIKQLNEERNLYNAHIGLHDIKLCVEAANDVSLEIDYE